MSSIKAGLNNAGILLLHGENLPDDNTSVHEGPHTSPTKISMVKTGCVDPHLSSYSLDYALFPTLPGTFGFGSIGVDAFNEDDEDLQLGCRSSFLEWTLASQLDLFRFAKVPARAPASASSSNENVLVKKVKFETPVKLPTKVSVKLQESMPVEYARPDVEQSAAKQWNQPETDQRNNYQVGQMQVTAGTTAASLYESSYMHSCFMFANARVPYGSGTIAHHEGSKVGKKQQSHGDPALEAMTVPHGQTVYQVLQPNVAHALRVSQMSDLEQRKTKKGGSKWHVSTGVQEQSARRRQQLRIGSKPATDQPPVAMFVDLSGLTQRK